MRRHSPSNERKSDICTLHMPTQSEKKKKENKIDLLERMCATTHAFHNLASNVSTAIHLNETTAHLPYIRDQMTKLAIFY